MAVEYNTVSPIDPTGGKYNGADGSQLSAWSHTVGGSATLLMVLVGVGTPGVHSDANTVTVTFGVSSLTSVAKVHANNQTNGFIQLFAKQGLSGTQNITVTVTGTYHEVIQAAAISLTGVDQLTPLGVASTGYGDDDTPRFAAPVVSDVNNLVAAFQCNGQGDHVTAVNSATARFDVYGGDSDTAVADISCATAIGSASVNPSFTLSGGNWWATIGIDIKTMNEGTPPLVVHSPIARYYG